MSRAHIPIRPMKAPLLDRWVSLGRALAVQAVFDSLPVVICVVYGFSKSHPEHHLNEILCAELMYWLSGLRQPVLLGGDFDESPRTATALALAPTWGLFHLTGEAPTTRGRSSHLASSEPLDHVFANGHMLDCRVHGAPDPTFWISDHLPLVGSFRAHCSSFQTLHWPKPSDLSGGRIPNPEWVFRGTTYAEWCSAAEKWISEAFGVAISPKLATRLGATRLRGSEREICL